MGQSKQLKNHLQNEKSPYLLQHARNPVNWYPWNNKVFEQAKKLNKPIFLSIGYSTCHWCHVMAHESFEDSEVADLLNETFICIKVDREERPDIDHTYMTVSQMLTGRGGWPLTIIMTPNKHPFFAATYIPKHTRFRQTGLMELIPQVQNLWKNQQEKLEKSGKQITTILQKTSTQKSDKTLSLTTLDEAYTQLLTQYDEQHGGFGQKPKFPTPHTLLFLLRHWKRTNNAYILKIVEHTLTKMRQGGMYDHVGFGFHRYSTDSAWHLPHFEKMLYDQALLIMAYTEAYQITKNPLYRKTTEEIITYVLRDMTSLAGGFYSAEDADSEGEEGKFYTWNYKELQQILSDDEFKIATIVYDLRKNGNFAHEISGKESGENILHQQAPFSEISPMLQMSEQQLEEKIAIIKEKLFTVREKRIHPGKDDKILIDWNGLMIAALAKAARVFDNKSYLQACEKTLSWLTTTMMKPSGELYHRYRDGDVKISGFADDYAFLIWGLMEAYEASFDGTYLTLALKLNDYLLNHFWDQKQGGFFFTANTNEVVLLRKKEIYDGAIPSANSVAMMNLLRLARITGQTVYEEKAVEIIRSFAHQVADHPTGYTHLMSALDFSLGPVYEVVIVGDEKKQNTQDMIKVLNTHFLPNIVSLFKSNTIKKSAIENIVPFVKDYTALGDQATAYVCVNQSCKQPTTDIDELLRSLR